MRVDKITASPTDSKSVYVGSNPTRPANIREISLAAKTPVLQAGYRRFESFISHHITAGNSVWS